MWPLFASVDSATRARSELRQPAPTRLKNFQSALSQRERIKIHKDGSYGDDQWDNF